VVFCAQHGGSQTPPSPTPQPGETAWEANDEAPQSQPLSDITSEWRTGQTLLDTYEVIGKLGEGGMGKVYRVHHKSWNIDLAVKQPKAEIFTTQKGKEAFIREAETWVDLGLHPHITSCYYVRTIEDIPHIFVEFMAGGSLEDWIQQKHYKLYEGDQQQVLQRILDIAIQFAWGLAYAHECSLVHQDVKPLNVLMTPQGVVKVTDFGLAKARAKAGESTGKADSHALVSGSLHTVAYRSPEQAKGSLLSHKTDIWSWGVSVLQMFNGEVSWMDGQAAATSLEGFLNYGGKEGTPPMPADLANLLRQCFQQDPDARPNDMLVIAAELQHIYQQTTENAYPREMPKAAELRADSLNNKALSMLDLGKEADAIDNWQMALKEDPQHLDTHFNFGYYQWLHAEILGSEFLSTIESLRNTYQNNPEYWRLLAWIYLEQGNVDAFQEVLRQNAITDQSLLNTIAAHKYPVGRNLHTFKGHNGQAYSIKLSNNGEFAISGGADHSVCLWDVTTGKEVHRFRGHKDEVCCVDISPNEKYAVSGSQDKTIRLWDLKSFKEGKVFKGHTDLVWSVCFSHDGRLILSGSMDKSVRLWDVFSSKEVQRFKGHQDSVTSVCFSANDKLALSGGYDKTLRSWDIQSGKEIQRFEGHKEFISSICFSLDTNYVYSSSMDRTIRLWDTRTGNTIKTYLALTDFISKIVCIPASQYLLCANADGTIRVLDIFTWREIRRIEGHRDFVRGVDIAKDKPIAGSCSHDGYIHFWEINFQPLDTIQGCPFPILSQVKTTIELQENKQLVSALFKEAQKGLRSNNYLDAYHLLRKAQAIKGFERDKSLLNLIHESAIKGKASRTNLENLWMVARLSGHTDFVYGAAMTPDQKRIVSASRDKTVRSWDISTGKTVKIMQGHTGIIVSRCFDLSFDGKFALTGGRDGTMRYWNVEEGMEIQRFDHRNVVGSLCFLPGSKFALSGCADGYLTLWDLATKNKVYRFKHPDLISCVCCSFDGGFALSGSDNKLFLWDLQTGKNVNILEGHTDTIRSAAITSDNLNAVTCSVDGSVRLWDLNNQSETKKYLGHIGIINDVLITSDNKYILSAGADKTIRIWDLITGQEIHKFEAHKDGVFSIYITSDGRYLVSGGADHEIYVWELDWAWNYPDHN
jgi:WD40 repeat protein